MQDWTALTISVPSEKVDIATDIANMVVPYGVYIEDYSNLEEAAWEIAHIDLIDEELLARDRTKAIIHIYISPEENPAEALAFLSERLTAEGIEHTLGSSQVCEDDWANNWKKYFKPLPVGEKLIISPTWEPATETEGRAVLSIDPGMAFGTGGHDTTRLVLETLEKYITPGVDVLDVGCGSGILSIAALLLGAGTATGVDIDPLAVRTAVENGELNGFTPPQYTMMQGDLATAVTGSYRVVVANIVADAIIMLSKDASRFLAEDGVYIVSGIIDTREQDVLAALAACNLTVKERRESGGWLCLVCVR